MVKGKVNFRDGIPKMVALEMTGIEEVYSLIKTIHVNVTKAGISFLGDNENDLRMNLKTSSSTVLRLFIFAINRYTDFIRYSNKS